MKLTKSELKQLIIEQKSIRDFLENQYWIINNELIESQKQLNKLNKK